MAKFRRQHAAEGKSIGKSLAPKVLGLFLIIILIFIAIERISPPHNRMIFNGPGNASHTYPLDYSYTTDSTWKRSLNFLPYATYGEVIVGDLYSLAYSETHEQAIWVAYELTSEKLANRNATRKNWFEADTRVTTGSSVHADYNRSGYTRGHLAPAEDFAFDQSAMDHTFLMSNISPQLSGFNGGIWRELEENIRQWARKEDHLYIVTGPIFDPARPFETIGKNKVAVPHAFFKIVLDLTPPEKKGIAFIIPHKVSERHLSNYVLSIREAESIVGIQFFDDFLEGVLHDSIETNYSIDQWNFDPYKFDKRIQEWNKQ
jgi:endonuclease G